MTAPSALVDAMKRHRPALLPGLAQTWPALARWSVASFAERFGAETVDARMFRRDGDGVARAFLPGWRPVPMRWDDFAARTLADGPGDDEYARLVDYPVMERHPALRDDVPDVAALLRRAAPGRRQWPFSAETPKLWVGPGRTRTPLHFDPSHNLYVQLAGEKEFLLVPPRESRRLGYPDLALSMNNFSPVDFERLAGRGEVEVHAFRVGPGDALFIPQRWWHFVRTDSASLALTFWWWSLDQVPPYLAHWGSLGIAHAARLRGPSPR